MTTAAPTDSAANGKQPATPAIDQHDLSAFYADRARQHREYVAGCIQFADKATRALQPRLGPDAKLAGQSLRPSPGQTQIAPNGILQENGVAVFGYQVDFQAPQMPPHAFNFFLSVGKLTGEKGKPDDWYIGHGTENFSLPSGVGGQQLEPLFAHIVTALEAEIVKAYPTDAKQEKNAQPGAPKAQVPV